MKYFKLLTQSLCHFGFQYNLGYNKYGGALTSNYGVGLYYGSNENICSWIDVCNNHYYIGLVHTPKSASIIRNKTTQSLKTNELILDEYHPLYNKDTVDWLLQNNVNIHLNKESYLQHAVYHGFSNEFIMYLIKECNCDPKALYYQTAALSKYGDLSLITYLFDNHYLNFKNTCKDLLFYAKINNNNFLESYLRSKMKKIG